MLVRTILAALVGGLLFDRLKVPAGALIGAMVGVAAANLLGGVSAPGPGPVLRFAALAVIGWELGAQIDRSSWEAVRSAAFPIIVVVGVLLVTAGLLAVILYRSGLDPMTAYLAASPGGISQMAALTAEFQANPVIVSIVHLMRVIAVVVITPVVVKLVT